ncbi:hypothetical protein CVT26_003604 [Gymnopilus dilepis]|uniref:Uncharacterized protein n=1 Tax=Gymnopilus dilepis TaxID=231916 RepID=A0A409W1U9_9AGAR|nr:hypothetical protein CVT26_003604 [Gymnopilus dilepis]
MTLKVGEAHKPKWVQAAARRGGPTIPRPKKNQQTVFSHGPPHCAVPPQQRLQRHGHCATFLISGFQLARQSAIEVSDAELRQRLATLKVCAIIIPAFADFEKERLISRFYRRTNTSSRPPTSMRPLDFAVDDNVTKLSPWMI